MLRYRVSNKYIIYPIYYQGKKIQRILLISSIYCVPFIFIIDIIYCIFISIFLSRVHSRITKNSNNNNEDDDDVVNNIIGKIFDCRHIMCRVTRNNLLGKGFTHSNTLLLRGKYIYILYALHIKYNIFTFYIPRHLLCFLGLSVFENFVFLVVQFLLATYIHLDIDKMDRN